MTDTLEEIDWRILLKRIRSGDCTPFLGAGASCGSLPLGSKIAREWADEHSYPLEDSSNLVRVAQFLAVQSDPMFPKDELVERFADVEPDFGNADKSLDVLATFPLPIYITTNYDDFMFKALKNRDKNPERELCRWNKGVKEKLGDKPSIFGSGFEPTVATPVVFHLHGYTEIVESLVLTEDDYLDFLINVSKDPDLIPRRIREAFAGTSLLFLGYGLDDWDFRVLFRTLVSYLERGIKRIHISVQLLPLDDNVSEAEKERVQRYFDRYFSKLDIHVYWGTCEKFIAKLKTRWEAFKSG